ncbi:MAG: hypothetical protein ACKO1O_03060 [Erythrobacter sp.]
MRLLFQNSRLALAFVVLTVLGAVAIIGPQGSGGPVTQAVNLSESQRGLLAGGAQGPAGAQGQPQAPPSVFGEYNPDGTATAAPAAPAANSGNPMTAPLASTAVVQPQGAVSTDPVIAGNEDPQ